MLEIRNEKSGDEVRFFSNHSDTLTMKIMGSKAEILEVKASDEEIYDALLKTAVAYAFRRNLTFDSPPQLKPTKCQSLKHHNVKVNGIEYEVVIENVDT